METSDVARRVAAEMDDVLATLPLVRENDRLTAHLYDQLVDLLLESMLVDLRAELAEGRISPADYAAELASLAGQCRAAGLLDQRA